MKEKGHSLILLYLNNELRYSEYIAMQETFKAFKIMYIIDDLCFTKIYEPEKLEDKIFSLIPGVVYIDLYTKFYDSHQILLSC